jgi:pseudomonalisin
MRTKVVFSALLVTASLLLGGGHSFAGTSRFIDDNDTVVLKGNTHPLARQGGNAKAQAALAATNLPMDHMIMSLQIPAAKQGALQQFLKEQKDPASPNYHHWLTPEEFGAKFGPSSEDVTAVTNWLSSHGFKIDEVSKSRTWINFSGDVSKVEQTFKTQIRNLQVGDKLYHANVTDPSIPRGLADLVSGVVTLHNIPRQPKNNGVKYFPSNQAVPNYTSGSSHYLAPGDFSAIYNVNALYSAGFDGTGQSIAIVGRTHPATSNWTSFRSQMGLPSNPPQVIVNGTDPGDLGSNEDTEANLDVEWAGAVAKNATIKFVTSKSTNTTDGVDLSAQYIVSNNIAPIMSVSFGSCESDMGSSENSFYNNLWSQAAAQGITVFVSAGDSGASACSAGSSTTGTVKAVNGLASTPYNIAVGGTQFSEGSGSYWNSVSSSTMTSATGYIPEVAWNESGTVSGGSGLWATGGGASQVYSKPSWQVAPGVPQDGLRDIPDVSLSAASHDAYLIYSNGSLGAVGGTSASSPSFAGLMALVVQKTGQRQGNANPTFYQMGNSQYSTGSPAVYHDITASNNSVPGVTGYNSGTAYDAVTGLGSVDAYVMVTNWGGTTVANPDFSLAAIPAVTVTAGQSATAPVQVSVSGGFNSSVSLAVSGLGSGVTATLTPTSFAAPGSGSATLTVNAASTATAGTSTVTVTATGGGLTHSQSFSVTVNGSTTTAADFSMTAATPQTMIVGSTGTVKVTTTAGTGFTSAVSFAVSGLPTGVTGSFSPASLAAPGTGSSTLTLNIASSTPVGSSNITVTATGGGVTHSVQVPITIQPSTVYSSSFSDSGWYYSQVYGSAGKWSFASSGTYPTAAPHSGTSMAKFGSYGIASGNQTRLYNGTRYTIPSYAKSATLSFWMYHDTGRSTNNDRIQPQVYSSSWANAGTAVSRYNGTTGWSQVNVNVSSYIGKSVEIGFLGISGGGYNIYVDDVALTVK